MNMDEMISSEEDVVRPTHVEVDLGCLAGNLAAIRAYVGGAKVMTVLKANAYGHGLIPVAHHMVKHGADYLGVAFLEEGVLLRKAGISAPILVLGGIAGEQIPLFLKYDLTLTAPSVEKLLLIPVLLVLVLLVVSVMVPVLVSVLIHNLLFAVPEIYVVALN